MSPARTLAHRAEAIESAATVTAGWLTSNRRMRARGRRGQAKGTIKRYAMKIKNAFVR